MKKVIFFLSFLLAFLSGFTQVEQPIGQPTKFTNGVSVFKYFRLPDTTTAAPTFSIGKWGTKVFIKNGSGVWVEIGSDGGGMVYPGAGIPLSTGSGWGTSITNNSTNWNTAYSERNQWDGGVTGLTASTGRTSLGATTVGSNLFTATNPSAIRYIQVNADNTVTFLDAAGLRTAIGAQATGNYLLQNGNSFTDHLGFGTNDNYQIRFKTNNVTHTRVTETGSWLFNQASSFGDYKVQATGGIYFDVTGKTMRVVGLGTDNTASQVQARDASGNTVWRDVSSIATTDGWGSQTVQTNATLTGDGTSGSPLAVDVDEVLNGVGVLDWHDGGGTGDSLVVVVNGDTVKIKSLELVAGTNVTITEEHTTNKLKYTINAASGGDPTMGGDLSGTASNAQINAGAVGTNELGTSVVTFAKIQNVTGNRIIGNPTATSGAPVEMTVGSGLYFDGTSSLMGRVADAATLGMVSTTDQTFGGNKTFANNLIVTGTGTFNSNLTAKRYISTQPTAINSTTTTTVDLSTGNIFHIDLVTNITTLTLNNTAVGTYILKFKQDATGGRTVVFPAGWLWSGGSVPTVTSTANKTDVITLVYDGTNYYASAIQNF